MAGAAAVFVVQQHDEVGMGGEVVEGGLDQPLDGLLRRQAFEVELAFLGADFLIDPFQHRQIQRVLVAEIMIDQLLVDAGARRDLVDPGAGEATIGKFTACRRQKLLPRRRRIAPLAARCYQLVL